MQQLESDILEGFRSLLQRRVPVSRLILFGSRARGDADLESDMDVVVVLDTEWDWELRDYISRCAWEAGFERGIVVVPVVFSRYEWENSPERSSLFVQSVMAEGIPV